MDAAARRPVAHFFLEAKRASEELERGGHVAIEEIRDDLRRPGGGRHGDLLAGDRLVLARPAEERDVAAFRALVGHENLVAVAVGLDTRAGKGVALRPRLRFLHAADG